MCDLLTKVCCDHLSAEDACDQPLITLHFSHSTSLVTRCPLTGFWDLYTEMEKGGHSGRAACANFSLFPSLSLQKKNITSHRNKMLLIY